MLRGRAPPSSSTAPGCSSSTADTAADPDVLHDLVRDSVAAHDVGLLRLQARTTTLEDVFLGMDP